MHTANGDARPIRRPAGLTFVAVLSNGTGLATALGALLWADAEPVLTRTETVLTFLATVCGLGAAIAGIGLLRVSPSARSLQIMISVVWILTAAGAVAWGDPRTSAALIGLLAFGSVPAAVALFHLTRASVALLFETAPERRAGRALLVVNAIVVAAALVVNPALRAASSRSQLKRTVADLRLIATALEAYAMDHGAYPRAGSFDELAPQISPTYLRDVPRSDAWKTPFRYEAWSDGGEPPQHYAIGSAGADRRFAGESLREGRSGTLEDSVRDLVIFDGEIVLGEAPPSPEAAPAGALDAATAAYEEHRYRNAIPLYRQVVGSNPDDALSHARLAFSLVQLERWDEARDALERAVALDPEDWKSQNNLALVCEKLDALDAGVRAARAAVGLRPDDAVLRNTLGFVLLRSGAYEEAIEQLRTAVRLDGTDAQVRLNLGRAFAATGDLARARAELARIETSDPAAAMELRAAIEASAAAPPKR